MGLNKPVSTLTNRQGLPPTPAPPLLHSVREAAQLLGVSRTTLFALLASNEISSVRIRRRRMIPATALTDFVARLGGAK